MFGLLLRSELLQGSAVRTWNCVLNIANFFRYKFNNLRQPVMPRTRRRHHSRSRSRSRSHSHDRDREPKRRRVESPDSSHHRRSVSAEKEVAPKEDASMEITSDAENPKEITSEENAIKKITVTEDFSKDDISKEDTLEDNEEDDVSFEDEKDESNEDKDESTEEKDISKNGKEDKLKDVVSKQITPSKITPKKVLSPMQTKKYEERLKMKHEREEQRRKEKEEKEERKRKEKEEKEDMKRKEREEKEDMKRKEREEKEEQKKKEKEDKEEQKRKEKEEKEEQKRKEREEKEEQKRKEKEEKELKRQQELDEKNKDKKKREEQILKEKTAFANFFRKSASSSELKKPNSEPEQTLAFMPFQVKSDMRLAPVIRTHILTEQKQTLLDQLTNQLETVLYLDELKNGKQLGSSTSTWPVLDDSDDVQILEDSDFGEKVEEQPKAKKMRAKLLKFHENRRPAYFGTWRKKSQQITPRKPLTVDKEFFDYEVDSDDDWEEEEPGESLHGSDDEDKENDEKDDYEVDNEFFVPHGYLSDEEIEAEENCEISPETQKEKLKILQEEFDEEMKSKTQKIKPRLIGCIWENKLIPKVHDAIHKFLEDRMMIVTGIIQIQKRDLLNTTVEVSGKFRKPLTKELIPDFLQLIHGNTRNQGFLVNEFYSYLSRKNVKAVSKASLLSHLKQFAKWKKCPEEGEMLNKYCWYVEEDIRSQYDVNLKLPNNWTYVGGVNDENGSKNTVAV